MEALTRQAMGDDDLSGAEYLAVAAWHTLHQGAKVIAAENGADVVAWNDDSKVN